MTTLTLSVRAVSHRVKSMQIPFLNWKVVYGATILSLAAGLVLYVMLINGLTQGSYLIKSYNREVDGLMTQSKDLQMNFAESGFLGNVQTRVRELSFEKTTEIKYIQILDNSLGMVK